MQLLDSEKRREWSAEVAAHRRPPLQVASATVAALLCLSLFDEHARSLDYLSASLASQGQLRQSDCRGAEEGSTHSILELGKR